MSGSYDDLSKTELIALLEKRDRTKKLGLVWERDEIEADRAIDANFVACEIVPNLSDKPAPWDNLIIEGDNYDALRWLRMTHAGQVKCIYIDPPYNTGKTTWVYNDRYVDPEDRFRQSTWLEFLHRRLTLAGDLLAEDGVLLVSINDDQRALLELMMDEALPGMRSGSLTWRVRTGGNEGGDRFFSVNHEHVLLFAKSAFRFGGTDKTFEKYSNPDDDTRGDWRDDNLTVSVSYDDKRAGKAYYPLYDPSTGIWYPCNPDRVWAYVSREHSPGAKIKTKFMEEFIADGQVLFPEEQEVRTWNTLQDLTDSIDLGEVPRSRQTLFISEELPNLEFWVGKKVGFGTPRFKRFKKDLRFLKQPLSSWVTPRSEVGIQPDDQSLYLVSGTNDEGAKAVKDVFGSKAFNYAKPVSLIKELIRQSTAPGDIVLDFFAGSATTAQAVMELNTEDHGVRRFIMVSSTEATDDEPDKNLCRDVTAERVRRLNASDDKKYANLAAGFAYLRTKEILFEDLDYDLPPADAWTALEAYHGLPLTLYDSGQPWNIHEGPKTTLILVDRFDPALIDWLQGREYQNIFVYSWAPGQIAQHLDGTHAEVRSVRETLVKAFQQ